MRYIRKNIEIFDKICYPQYERGGFFIMQETIMKDIYNETNAYYNDSSKRKKKSRNGIFCFFESIHYLHELKKGAKMINFTHFLEKKEGVCSGNYVLKNTRIRPEIIFEYLLSHTSEDKGVSIVLKDIEKNYPTLDEEKIMVSLMYCFKNKSLIRLIHEIASR